MIQRSINEGFEDIVTSEGKHFYDNHEGENDTLQSYRNVQGLVSGLRFLCNSRTGSIKRALSPFNAE
jgi:hypothetical protein